MLKLSYSHNENNFAVPYEKYVVKTKTSPDLKIMTYLGNGEFKRDLFGFDVKGLSNYKIKSNDTERYIVPLDAILKNQSYKKLMRKEEITKKGKTTSKYIEDYSYFLNAIRTAFNALENKIPAEFDDDKTDVAEIKIDQRELFDLVKMQLELSTDIKRQEYLAQYM
jgi:hypothetical protein